MRTPDHTVIARPTPAPSTRKLRGAIATAALLGAALAAALPGSASAGILTQDGTTLVYTAASGEQNALQVLSKGSLVADLMEQRTAVRITSQTPTCVQVAAPPSVRCALSGISRLVVRLGDKNDFFSSGHPFPVTLEGGSGDDTYSGLVPKFGDRFDSPSGVSQVTFLGGSGRDQASYQQVVGTGGVVVTKDNQPFDGRPGDRDDIRTDVEELRGSGQSDVLAGSSGADRFISSAGTDTLAGGAGDDVFLMGAISDGATRVDGGEDRDTVSYAQRSRRLVITADDPNSTDGESGEGDQIAGTEVIEGGTFSDTMVVPAQTTLGYRLIGGDGNDFLVTSGGRDRLIGGRGEDRLFAGANQDVIEARDGERDPQVDCGTNGSDQVFRDLSDPVVGCEVRFPIVQGQF